MTATITKKNLPFTVTYGVAPGHAMEHLNMTKSITCVNAGWIILRFGRSKTGRSTLYAITGKENMLLCPAPAPEMFKPRIKKPTDWVYGIGNLPTDFLDGRHPPVYIESGSIKVLFGKDSASRDFMTVDLPDLRMTLLLRNPESASTAAWNPAPATALTQHMTLRPNATPGGLAMSMSGETTGDDDLDELLNQLSS
jgi:hypothetical protein